MHKPLFLRDLSLVFPEKCCFENFTCQISFGSRIAVVGRNGSGKSTLLKILQGNMSPATGEVLLPDGVQTGYVQQTIEEHEQLSGGQRLNRQLTEALAKDPNLLLLDEPTNHLDLQNRKSLMRMLCSYHGTLIVASHDEELLRTCIDTLWHIDHGKITIFSGHYDDYIRKLQQGRQSTKKKLSHLERERRETHQRLMKEQKRAAKSRAKGRKQVEQRKWPTVVSKTKSLQAEQTSGRKSSAIDRRKQELTEELETLRPPEVILPTFSLEAKEQAGRTLLSVHNGSLGYKPNAPLLQNVYLSLEAKERVAISGGNGSGKSTLLRAILGNQSVVTTGDWHLPGPNDVGYLDQHYANLDCKKTVYESLAGTRKEWSGSEIRKHLAAFLFRKSAEVNTSVEHLSGGEKARLSLSLIAAKTPKLLVLDEITNNLDLETKEHVVQVLSNYPGAILVVSHDTDFLEQIAVSQTYAVVNHTLTRA